MPDTVFKVNGYEYETDYLGRTIRAEGQPFWRGKDE